MVLAACQPTVIDTKTLFVTDSTEFRSPCSNSEKIPVSFTKENGNLLIDGKPFSSGDEVIKTIDCGSGKKLYAFGKIVEVGLTYIKIDVYGSPVLATQ